MEYCENVFWLLLIVWNKYLLKFNNLQNAADTLSHTIGKNELKMDQQLK